MANILLTNICNQKCPYCFAVDEIRRKRRNNNLREMSLKDLRTVLDFFKKNKERNVRLMGGEPTLHSKLEKTINYIFSRGFKVHIFTNGLFSSKITDFLVKKEEKIKYSFNINPPDTYSSQKWNQILKNLKILTPFKNCLIGGVIWQENFNIDYLLDLANKYPIRAIILRMANPVIGQNNKYFPLRRYSSLAKDIIREIKKSDKDKIRIGLGCGFSKKMFSKEQLQVLRAYKVVSRGWGCDGNSGRFDIGTDLSAFRCFPLSNWQKKKLTDFNNPEETEDYFSQLMEKYQSDNSDIDFIHQGPCFAYLLSKDL